MKRSTLLYACLFLIVWTGQGRADDKPVVIHAQKEMIMNKKACEGWALGDPEAWHNDQHLKGDRLKVLFDSETQHVSQIEALGHMSLTSPTQRLQGDTGLYDVGSQYAWCKGEKVILCDPIYTLTTQGILQVWNQKRYGLTRGPSLLEMEHRRLWGQMMTIQQALPAAAGAQALIERAEAFGDVFAISEDVVAQAPSSDAVQSMAWGDRAFYNGHSQELTVTGRVSCQREFHHLQGEKVLVDEVHQTTTVWAAPHSSEDRIQGALLYPSPAP